MEEFFPLDRFESYAESPFSLAASFELSCMPAD
jgi:hypothetical protein